MVLMVKSGPTGKFRFSMGRNRGKKQPRLLTPGDGENGATQGAMKQVRRGKARRTDRKLGNDELIDELM